MCHHWVAVMLPCEMTCTIHDHRRSCSFRREFALTVGAPACFGATWAISGDISALLKETELGEDHEQSASIHGSVCAARSRQPSGQSRRRTRVASGLGPGPGPAPVRSGGPPEGPWRDGEEGQSGGFHEGDAGTAHVRLQQRRGADSADARSRQLRGVQRAGGPGAQRRSQGLLQLAHDPSGVLQRGVCGWLRHPAADAPERRPGGGAEEAGHPLCTAGRRERVQVEEGQHQTSVETEDKLNRLNTPITHPLTHSEISRQN